MKQHQFFFLTVIIAGLAFLSGPVFSQDTTPTGDAVQLEPMAASALLGTAFTYQGQLMLNGTAVSGVCDFQFRLYNALSGGSQIGATQTKSSVAVGKGLFTVANLDFGAGAFNGEARWLAVSVRCPAGSGSYTNLTPRQALTAAPYALALPGLYTIQDATSPDLVGGHFSNAVAGGVYGASISGGGYSGQANRVTDNFGVIGGGAGNQAGDNAGTTSDKAFTTVGGGFGNIASEYSSTVGGGYQNSASGFMATVGGGTENSASAASATVSGGNGNIASASSATVGGGSQNSASGSGATVGGGSQNTASVSNATVGGGLANMASGIYAAVPGGYANTAAGSYSFAAGRQAKANHTGAFVWGGGVAADFASPASNTFNVRASGGIWLGTTNTPSIPVGRFINTSTGAYLTTSGVWTNSSDQNAKENIVPVDAQFVLAQVAVLPISTWNYLGETAATRHMGPMAQDFHAAFGLGADDLAIGTIDADGVALAAIQGLYQLAQEQEAEIAALTAKTMSQEAEITALAERLTALEKQAGGRSLGLPRPSSPGWLALALSLSGVVAGLVWYGRREDRS
jgi:trimeric autotransporter adhesin